MGAVDMEGHEVVAAHAGGPARIDLGDDAAFQLEGRIGRVIGVAVEDIALLVDALRNMGGAQARDGLHFAEEIVHHIAPVAQHIEDDAAAVLLAIVPARALRLLPVALEHPIAELAAHREDLAEEAAIPEHLDFHQARQEQLVLHHAMLEARGTGRLGQIDGDLEIVGGRFFAIDMLAGGQGPLEQARAHQRCAGIEEDGVFGIGECRIEIRAPARNIVLLGQRFDLVAVAPDNDRIDDKPVAIFQHDAALVADRQDRAHQVLVVTHASGDAMHDYAKPLLCHLNSSQAAAFGVTD